MATADLNADQSLAPTARASDQVHLEWLSQLGIKSFAGLRVLDVGCGSGFLARLALEQGALDSVGLDIEKPREGFGPHAAWTFVQADLDRANWQVELLSKSFDLILAFDIIEHLRSPVAFLEQCRALLQSQGKLFLTTPNVQSLERILHPKTWSGAFDPQHRILFSPYSLKFLMARTGFRTLNLSAPMRLLRWLPFSLQPAIGGQLLLVAHKN